MFFQYGKGLRPITGALLIVLSMGFISPGFAEEEYNNFSPLSKLGSVLSTVIIGSALDYLGNELSQRKLRIGKVKGFTISPWAGHIYLADQNKDHNGAEGASEMITNSPDLAEAYAKGYCSALFPNKTGYYMVDNFSVQALENSNLLRLTITGNAICIIRG